MIGPERADPPGPAPPSTRDEHGQVTGGYGPTLLAIIEVKLANNAEARRAVVAQVLAYAANLRGLTTMQLERDVLARHLHERGYDSLFAAALGADQAYASEGDRRLFDEGLAASLADGSFRLVIVLDEVPSDLVTLVGYLEDVTERLIVDLITVARYDVGDQQLVVPTRVEPERLQEDARGGPSRPVAQGLDTPGIDEFQKVVAAEPPERREMLGRLCDWASQLVSRGLATVTTYLGPAGAVLRVYVPGDMSLLTVNTAGASPSVQLFRSVFDRRAPNTKARIEALVGTPIAQGTAIREFNQGMLDAFTAAYEEAATGKLSS